MYDRCMADLTRVTVNLTAKTLDAVDVLVEGWDCSRTDAMNRGLQLAGYVMQLKADGSRLYTREPEADELTAIEFL